MDGNPRHIVIETELFVYSSSDDKIYEILDVELFSFFLNGNIPCI